MNDKYENIRKEPVMTKFKECQKLQPPTRPHGITILKTTVDDNTFVDACYNKFSARYYWLYVRWILFLRYSDILFKLCQPQ